MFLPLKIISAATKTKSLSEDSSEIKNLPFLSQAVGTVSIDF